MVWRCVEQRTVVVVELMMMMYGRQQEGWRRSMDLSSRANVCGRIDCYAKLCSLSGKGGMVSALGCYLGGSAGSSGGEEEDASPVG